MKLRTAIRLTITISVLLLCIGFGVYSYWRVRAINVRHQFELYSLVPQDAIAVVETDDICELVSEINEMACSRNQTFLYASELFSYLKKYLSRLADDTPHGLSPQMNRMLLSFHKPYHTLNQVLYIELGRGDGEFVETFLNMFGTNSYPSKSVFYRNERLNVYPADAGRFLVVYRTDDFLAISFEKRLIEKVVDARLDNKSLLHTASFHSRHDDKHQKTAMRIGLCMAGAELDEIPDALRSCVDSVRWIDFEIMLKDNLIFASGEVHQPDILHTTVNLDSVRPSDATFADRIPASAFYFTRKSFTMEEASLHLCKEWGEYLTQSESNEVLICYFLNENQAPCTICSISMPDAAASERMLRGVLPVVGGTSLGRLAGLQHTVYQLPSACLVRDKSVVDTSSSACYLTFYKGYALLSSGVSDLQAYISALEAHDYYGRNSFYEDEVRNLLIGSGNLLLVDMETLFQLSDNFANPLPSFFSLHRTFFSHFIIAMQVNRSESVVMSDVALFYKDKN